MTNTLGAPERMEDYDSQIDLIEKYVREQRSATDPIHVLEAGCGQSWPLDLGDVPFVLTGVDLDPAALEIRKSVQRDLDEAIVGDLHQVELPAESFEVIYNSFVLEHVERADEVLTNFAQWLKPGGILVLKIPDRHSVRGFLTAVTPHWFHVFYYRYALGYKDAGKPGHAPYRTFYHPSVSRLGIRRFCRTHDFVLREELVDGSYLGRGVVATASRRAMELIALFSGGRLSAGHVNLLYVLQKAGSVRGNSFG